MTTHILPRRRPARNPLRLVLQALALRRQRIRLGQLDDRLLRDIGITRQQAQAESSLPLWPAPDHWRI